MGEEEIINKMVVLNSTYTLPSDIVIKIYESKADVTVKETCFGLIIRGTISEVNMAVKEIRNMDPMLRPRKERGVPPGDSYQGRAGRGGGVKPGFHMHEIENKLLPYITGALEEIEKGIPHEMPVKSHGITIERLKEIINEEAAQAK